MKNKLAVYTHIPFCRKKCYYCDFISFTSNEETRKTYLQALVKEMGLYREEIDKRGVSSLYFGGGTPSLLSLEELDYLLDNFFRVLNPQGELTFEMNPEDVNQEKLSLLRSYGNFRISLGAQSFDDEVLSLFGRSHGVEEIYRAVGVLDEMAFENYSLDLIYAIAEEHRLEHSLDVIADILPSHISAYALELHPTRPLSKILQEADEDLYNRDWDLVKARLEELGYERYELSSFARDKKYGFHNMNHWQGGDYLGLGLSAHGYIRPYRYANERNLRVYHEKISRSERPLASRELIEGAEERFEYFMLGLRMAKGIDIKGLYPLTNKEEKAIEKHLAAGLLIKEGSWLRLSDQGFDLFNHVLVDFL